MYRKYLELTKDRILKTKEYGEVTTPRIIINELLDELQLFEPNIFNRKLSILDPCCGAGNFFIEIIPRIKNKDTNLLGLEINIDNVNIAKEVLNKNCNIICCNSLEYKTNELFDIIITNPPYNFGTRQRGCDVYHKFIKKYIELLKQDGYLIFLTPPNWRKPNRKNCRCYGLQEKMTIDRQLVYLHINNKDKMKKLFGAETRIDYYIIKNTKPNEDYTSKVIDINGDVNFIKPYEFKYFIPNSNFEYIKSIINPDNAFEILECKKEMRRCKKYTLTQQKDSKHIVIHTTTKRKPMKLFYSNEDLDEIMKHKKLIIGRTEPINPHLDENGIYGITDACIAINVEEFTNKQINKIKENIKKIINESLLFANFQIEFQLFKLIDKKYLVEFII